MSPPSFALLPSAGLERNEEFTEDGWLVVLTLSFLRLISLSRFQPAWPWPLYLFHIQKALLLIEQLALELKGPQSVL